MGPHFCCRGAAAVVAPGVRGHFEWGPGARGHFEGWGSEERNCYCQARFQAVHGELGHSGHFAWFHSRGHDPKIPEKSTNNERYCNRTMRIKICKYTILQY